MTQEESVYGIFRPTPGSELFENLVTLQVTSPGNRLGDRFPLNLLLEAGEAYLKVPIEPRMLRKAVDRLRRASRLADEYFVVRIQMLYCDVQYRENQVSIDLKSKYRYRIPKDKYKVLITDSTHSHTGWRIKGSLGVRVVSSLVSAILPFQAGANADITRVKDQSRAIKQTGIMEVFAVNQHPNGWRVGDKELGDPTKIPPCLNGPYFNERVVEYPQSCMAVFGEGQQRGTLTFSVIVRRDGLRVERADGGSGLKRDTLQRVTDTLHGSKMRNKIAAIRVEQERGLDQSRSVTNDVELVIANVACEIVRARDDEPSCGPSAGTGPGDSAAAPEPSGRPPVRPRRPRSRQS